MCARTAAAPSARSPAVWFSKTISSAWKEQTASRSWRFHASLYDSISAFVSMRRP
jgi:hypothetical protein